MQMIVMIWMLYKFVILYSAFIFEIQLKYLEL